MFSKHPSKSKLPTIVNEETQFKGDITSIGEVQIDGKVTGNIAAATLHIGKNAEICGNIIATQVEHLGKIIGNVETHNIHLVKGSHIEGDVRHHHISIETGAFINGVCQHIAEPAPQTDTPNNIFPLPKQKA